MVDILLLGNVFLKIATQSLVTVNLRQFGCIYCAALPVVFVSELVDFFSFQPIFFYYMPCVFSAQEYCYRCANLPISSIFFTLHKNDHSLIIFDWIHQRPSLNKRTQWNQQTFLHMLIAYRSERKYVEIWLQQSLTSRFARITATKC